jgi:hypothetical protein
LEFCDSCSNTNTIETPVSKLGAKRSSDNLGDSNVVAAEIGEASITKPARAVRVKMEPEDEK